MLKLLDTLDIKYTHKKIYIWDTGRDSMAVFALLAFRRIPVEGFVCIQPEYAGLKIMNRPVYHVEDIQQMQDVLIIVPDEVKPVCMKCRGVEYVYYSECLSLDQKLSASRIIIYGTGGGADDLCCTLLEKNLSVSLFMVTDKGRQESYKGIPVIGAGEYEQHGDEAIIISVMNEDYKYQILECLYRQGVIADIYIREFVDLSDCWSLGFIQLIDRAIKDSKKIYLYGRYFDFQAEFIKEFLDAYGADYGGFISEMEKDAFNLFELAAEGINDKFIISMHQNPSDLADAADQLEDAGFSIGDMNFTAFKNYTLQKDYLRKIIKSVPDPLTGFSLKNPRFPLTGWAQYGTDTGENTICIIVLGGSTSAEGVYRTKCWADRLYWKLLQTGIETVIYNGAHPGADITVELLRLLRDGYYLKPDIVISMSGINNTYHKGTENEFNGEASMELFRNAFADMECSTGIPSDESLYDFWLRNLNLMKMVSEQMGADFLGFLQPMNVAMDEMSLEEKSWFVRERVLEGAGEFARRADDKQGYINLMRIFEHRPGMYMDAVHYTDRACEEIALKVWDSLRPVLIKRQKSPVKTGG